MLISSNGYAQTVSDECILKTIRTEKQSMTISEIRALCEKSALTTDKATVYESSALEERLSAESQVEQRPFVITPHRSNYIMWTTSQDPNQAPYEEVTGISNPLKDNEMKFQLSIKAPIWQNMFGSNIDTYFAYTTQSWWQMSNDDISAPFRETNYEPEIFLRSFSEYDLFGIKLAGWSLGFNHQSNGRSEPLSRSWNRLIGRVALEANDDLNFLVRAWYRIEEDEEDDDNPNMHHYYGYGDVRAIWTPNRNTFTAMLRPGTKKTSYELTWSYPLSKVFRVFAQYYNGAGESLVDYNYDTERFGIGIALNDYLMKN
jgi:phospholipase A1